MQNDNIDIQDTAHSDQPAPPKKKRGGGPKTPEGKARSSRNAVVHGFTATQFTFLAHEEYAELDEIIARYMQDFQPTSQIAIDLVNELASCRFRLNRISNTETWLYHITMDRLQGKPGSIEEPDGQLAVAFRHLADNSSSLALIHRYETRFTRRIHQILTELKALGHCPPPPPSGQPDASRRDTTPKPKPQPLPITPVPQSAAVAQAVSPAQALFTSAALTRGIHLPKLLRRAARASTHHPNKAAA